MIKEPPILRMSCTIFQPISKELLDTSRCAIEHLPALDQEGDPFREKEFPMKRNSLSLHKTRIVIASLLVSAILVLTFFVTTLTGFAHKATADASCSGNALGHLSAASKATTLQAAKTHLAAGLACLGGEQPNN